MLKKIPKILSPELLKILCEMGHSDEIVIADGNFPSAGVNDRVVRYDSIGIPDLLEAILDVFPIDQYVEKPVVLMKTGEEYPGEPEIWEKYIKIISSAENKNIPFEYAERFDFYEKAKKAYAVIATGEEAIYANIILKKGVIK